MTKNFLVFPHINPDKVFPPEVRQAFANSPEVQTAVANAVSADETVVNAAADAATTAVDGELLKKGVFTGAFQILSTDTIALSFADQDGNRSWIEVGHDGAPTPEAVSAIVAAISGSINSMIATAIAANPGSFKVINDGSGIRVAFVDSEDQRSWLEIGEDGGPTQHTIDQIQDKLEIPAGNPDTVKVSYSSELIKVASGPDFHLLGDSMTASGWGTTLATLTGRTVWSNGVGGETSVGIAARSNAIPYLMLPVGGSIPASGGVEVTFTSAGGGQSWPLLQGAGNPGGMTGTLAGVLGTITLVRPPEAVQYVHHADDEYIFTRAASGSVVPVTRPTAFYYTYGEEHRGDITVIWAGRNNWSESNGDRAFRDIKAMTDYLKALEKRFLVLSIHNGGTEGTGTAAHTGIVLGLNPRLLAEYGRRFIDHRKYIIDYGLVDKGITPTAQDLTDIANDAIPTSLRSDNLHQNDAGKQLTAEQVNLRARELGWV